MKADETKRTDYGAFGLLAGGLAHDYNNMLTSMLGGMDLILCDDIPATAREAAEDVKAMMLKAATLVRRMLSCATGAEAKPEPLDLGEAVGDVVRIMRRSIPDNVLVRYKRPEGLLPVLADVAMVWQAVMNLVLNACEAIGGAAGTVEISVKTVAGPSGGRCVEVAVSDDGCGMDEATKARIFEPLFTTKSWGNGLGLASVRSVMGTLGGEVRVESAPGKGATFRLLFPVEGEQGEDSAAEAERAQGPASSEVGAQGPVAGDVAAQTPATGEAGCGCVTPGAARPENAAILVVDDDAAILKLLKIILGKAGYGVVTAQSGEDGLAAYHAAGGAFATCLIDASMGAGMSGLDLCAAIRAEAPGLPLILMSAYRAREMNDRMEASGVTTFLAKPFRGGDVVSLCAKYAGGVQ